MNTIRRSSYASVILLSVQSFKSSDRMAFEIAKMSTAAIRASTLSSASGSDMALSKDFANKAELDQAEASSLHAHAAELELESEREEALAKENRVSAEDYQAKAAAEEAEADAELAEATAEEVIFQEEREKAIGETAEAAREHAQTESDALATGICEWIPFLDLVCDVIGGVAAVGFETSAAQLTAQSVLDFAAASAAKAKEDGAIAEMEALQAKAAEDEAMASGFNAKAEELELEAAEERAEGAREEAKAEELFAESKEENALAEEEAGKGEEEAMESEEQTEKVMNHGISALYHAIVAGLLSFVSMVFFAIRFLIAVIIPGGEAIVGFVPMSLMLPTGQRVASMQEFGRNAWMILPKQQISYFTLHCSVLGTTMVGFCSKFQGLENLDVRSRGGILLIFALVAAAVQGLLLHSIPHVVGYTTSTSTTNVTARSESVPISNRIMGAIGILAHSMLYLIPLFLMEIVEIYLLAGKKFFSSQSLQALNTVFVGGALVLSAFLYTLAFHRWTATDCSHLDSDDSHSSANDFEAADSSDSKSNVIDDGAEDDNIITTEMHVDESASLLRSYQSSDSQIDDVESTYGGTSFGFEEENENSRLSASASASASASTVSIISSRETDNCQAHSESDNLSTRSLPTAMLISNDHADLNDGKSTSSYSRCDITASVINYDELEKVEEEVQPIMTTTADPSTPIISQYITDLKLPFEVLVITCMFVKLRECAPVMWKLGPQFVQAHPRLFIDCGGLLVAISLFMWCLVSSNKNHGHTGVWTGRFSTINV